METSRLAAIDLFADLEPRHLDALAAVARESEAAPGEELATQGDFGHALYAIEEGTAEVTRDGETVRMLGPGDVFGEVAVIAAGRRTATVVAATPMRLIVLFKRDIWALEKASPEASLRLRQLVADRLATPAAGWSLRSAAEGEPAGGDDGVRGAAAPRVAGDGVEEVLPVEGP